MLDWPGQCWGSCRAASVYKTVNSIYHPGALPNPRSCRTVTLTCTTHASNRLHFIKWPITVLQWSAARQRLRWLYCPLWRSGSDEAVPCGEPVCQPEISTDEQCACVITADRAGAAPGLMLGFMLVNYWRERNWDTEEGNSLITKPELDGLCFMYFLKLESFKSIQLAKKNKNPFSYL